MKFYLPLYFFLQSKPDIKNIDYPNCKDCIYFKKDPHPLDESLRYTFSKCEFFGEKDVVSGKIEYRYTSSCRIFDSLCGKEGKYYKEKK